VALDLLKQHRAPEPKRPPYPIYDWKKVRETVALKAKESRSGGSPVASTKSDR
jgi:hypothetical protein